VREVMIKVEIADWPDAFLKFLNELNRALREMATVTNYAIKVIDVQPMIVDFAPPEGDC